MNQLLSLSGIKLDFPPTSMPLRGQPMLKSLTNFFITIACLEAYLVSGKVGNKEEGLCWSAGAIRGREDPGTGTTPLPGVIRRGFRGVPEAL